MKIQACVNNAIRFLETQKEFGSFDKYIWDFVDYQPINNAFSELKELPAKTPLSAAISADLKKRGKISMYLGMLKEICKLLCESAFEYSIFNDWVVLNSKNNNIKVQKLIYE